MAGKKDDKPFNDMVKNLLTWAIIAVVLLSIFNHYAAVNSTPNALTYSDFLDDVRNGTISQVNIESSLNGNQITGRTVNGQDFSTFGPPDPKLVDELVENRVEITAEPPAERSVLVELILNVTPVLLLIGLWVYFMRQMQGGAGGRGAMSFGKSRAKLQGEDQVNVTFADVAGVEEAKQEVEELVEFLRNPGKFQKLGGHIPRGVLMVGSPGTGKTLLARAIAGEAKVPFFSISGSDFVEMFVGVGASRVRDMFDQAKKHAPCIIFIDEIDAVGRHRGAGLGGGHDEREQTLNALLVEMDGFEANEGVILLAATNRPDVLDPALLRPGRFDRQVVVDSPDIKGREGILRVHAKKLPLAEDVEVTGPVEAFVYLSTDVRDTDVVVKLLDVYPDGRAIDFSLGIARARYRNSFRAPELLTPGEVVELRVEMYPTSNLFAAGHRIRIEVTSSCFPVASDSAASVAPTCHL